MKASAKDKAIALLARREHSRQELQIKLLQRQYPICEIEQVLNKLEQENLLCEQRYIGSYIRLARNKGYGPLKICAQLQKRGIDRSHLLKHPEWQQSPWNELVIAVRIKRFGINVPQTQVERGQQGRFLQQRGFTAEQIQYAFNDHKVDYESW